MSHKIIMIFAVLFCFSINTNTSFAQIKKIHLEDITRNYGASSFNLNQQYYVSKGELKVKQYGFSGTDEVFFSGGYTSMYINIKLDDVPFRSVEVSLDNSTIIGTLKDSIYVYDIASEKIRNKFIVKNIENIKRIKTNGDGSIAFVDVGPNVKIIDTNSGDVLKDIECNVESWDLSSNDRYLALNETEFVYVYDFWEGGEPFVYESRVVSKKKKSSSEFIHDVNITSDGLMSMSIALRGRVKKNFFRKQEYAVIDVKNGNRVFELKLEEDDKEWYFYSLDPTGKVFYAKSKFYDLKTKKEIEVVRKGENREGKKFSSWKFHPHIPGVYHAERGEGVTGMYSFE